MGEYSTSDLERDYYLGNYQTCISKANSMPISRSSVYYMCLSYCHMKKFDNVERELAKAKSIDLENDDSYDGDGDDEDDRDSRKGGQAGDFGKTFLDVIKAFMVDLTSNDPDNENTAPVKMIDQLDSSKTMKPNDDQSRIVAAAIYARHKLFAKALQIIDGLNSLRVLYNRIIVYIMMNRGDLAEKQLVKMQSFNRSAPITELAAAQVCLAIRKPTEAWRVAKNLTERFRPTPLLNNLLTAAAICLDDYEPAKQFCESSLDMDSDNLEALINIIHILTKLRSSEQVLERNLVRLKELYPYHEFVRELEGISVDLAAI